MKKITPVEIIVILIVLSGFGLYLYPKITVSLEQKQYTRMQTNAAMITSKILSEVSDTTNKELPDKYSEAVVSEMNKNVKNPINKNNPAYSIINECEGCIVVTPDNKLKSITVAGKDKSGNLVVRTVIQPPSYVTFNKDFNKK